MRRAAWPWLLAALAGPLLALAGDESDALRQQVLEAERAFSRTMSERDHEAFTRHLADDAVFFSGADQVLRGKAAVAAAWKRYFVAPAAPFTWEPDRVEVLASGTLALSSGPVRDSSGKLTGRFNSIWRRGPDGRWRVVFDKGEPPPCQCGEARR